MFFFHQKKFQEKKFKKIFVQGKKNVKKIVFKKKKFQEKKFQEKKISRKKFQEHFF